MAIGPIGGHIYVNQNMQVAASKQTDFQNRLDLQNAAASSNANEKGTEVREIRPAEEIYKIDPEKEHQKKKNEEESGAQEEENAKDTKNKKEKAEDEEQEVQPPHLDIKI